MRCKKLKFEVASQLAFICDENMEMLNRKINNFYYKIHQNL